ncbi:MAG: acyltransferase [Alphaproteobacteria bacterium]|nr:acyltransferase [Alphaproteobacteria bacterium]
MESDHLKISVRNNNFFPGVQVLRGVAAMFVVLSHILIMLNERLDCSFNLHSISWPQFGVDIFFPISGFIMVMATSPQWGLAGLWRAFLTRRIIRIVPLYWIVTGLKIAIIFIFPGLAIHSIVPLSYAVASFFLIPPYGTIWTGATWPVVNVGWTLSFEMMFYIIFAVALAFSRRPIPWVASVLCLIVFAGLFSTPDWWAGSFLLGSLNLEFVFGMIVGLATLAGKRLPIPLAYAAVVVAGLLVWISMLDTFRDFPRFISWGIPGVLLLAATLALEERWIDRLSGWPTFIGDASYSIYLTHVFAVSFVGFVMQKAHMTSHVFLIIAVIISIIASIAGGAVVHIYIERVLLKKLHKMFV